MEFETQLLIEWLSNCIEPLFVCVYWRIPTKPPGTRNCNETLKGAGRQQPVSAEGWVGNTCRRWISSQDGAREQLELDF